MKKKWVVVGIIIIIIVSLSLFFALKYKFNSNPYTELPVNDNIVMEAKMREKENILELYIFNHDKGTVHGDLFYEIQIFGANVWKDEWKDTSVNALGIEISSGEFYVQKILLYDIDMKKGKVYRIKKMFDGNVCYSNEFTIE